MSRVRLRPTHPEDLEFVLAAEARPDIRSFILPYSRGRHAAALADADIGHFIAERTSDARPVGFVILAGLADPGGGVELRRVVVVEQATGYGREILRWVKRVAFGDVGARRLWLDVFEDNDRARDLYRAEGFQEEGTVSPEGDVGLTRRLVVMSLEPCP